MKPRTTRPSAPPDTVIYAIGDVHGRCDLLARLQTQIVANAAQRSAKRRLLVLLGDYVSRGVSSRRVIEMLLAPPPDGFQRIALRGNHEDPWLRYLDGDLDAGRPWFDYDGLDTLADYGVDVGDRSRRDAATVGRWRERFAALLPPAHLAFVRSTPACHRSGDYLFAHAGVRPGVPIAEQDARDLMWIRQPFIDSDADHGVVIVHGHSVAERPVLRANRIGIDTAAYRSGVLSCVVLEGEHRNILQS